MTVGELHIAFKIGYDKIDNLSYPNLLPEEIDFYLNQAQERFINDRYGTNNFYQTGFEETQKRTDDLRALVTEYSDVVVLTTQADRYVFNLPANYRYMVRLNAEVQNTQCGTNWTSVKLVQHDDLDNMLWDPFNKPIYWCPVVVFMGNSIYLYADSSYVINNARITYIREPLKISLSGNITSELAVHTHQEIVDMAISIALETIESPRFQSQMLSQSKQE